MSEGAQEMVVKATRPSGGRARRAVGNAGAKALRQAVA